MAHFGQFRCQTHHCIADSLLEINYCLLVSAFIGFPNCKQRYELRLSHRNEHEKKNKIKEHKGCDEERERERKRKKSVHFR